MSFPDVDQPEPESRSFFEQQKAKSPRSPTNLVKSTPAIWKPSGPSLVKKEYKPVRLDTSPKPEKRFNQKVSLHYTLLRGVLQMCAAANCPSHEIHKKRASCKFHVKLYVKSHR